MKFNVKIRRPSVLCVISMLSNGAALVARAFSGPSVLRRHQITWPTPLSLSQITRHVHSLRDADAVERMVGGERYEYAALPDSMLDTTLFVGNLDEFVNDDDLSNLFQSVSRLKSVPACVARKPDMSSLRYGFVTFPSKEEKDAAVIRFHGRDFRGKPLKVEEIRDSSGHGRVRVPERMVAYVSGDPRKANSGHFNGLRRISRDDVERLSRGQPSKRKGYGSRNVPHRLNDDERAELLRAARKGYVTLAGLGNRRTRKGSPLANLHRQWCDARGKPQILLYKALRGSPTSTSPVDQLVVDLSPLRLLGMLDDTRRGASFFVQWKTDILGAATEHDMQIRDDFEDRDDGDDDDDDLYYKGVLDEADREAWATRAIWKLPVVSMGVFEGERTNAKAMARALAQLWDIPDKGESRGPANRRDAGAKQGGRTKMKGRSQYRTRSGGHRQSLY